MPDENKPAPTSDADAFDEGQGGNTNPDTELSLHERIAVGLKEELGVDVSDEEGYDPEFDEGVVVSETEDDDGEGGDGEDDGEGTGTLDRKPGDGEPAPKEGEGEGEDPDPDAKVEDEIKALGIKTEPAQKRYREMAGKIKDLSSEVEKYKEDHQTASALRSAIQRTDATPEQVQAMFGYFGAINGNDIDALKMAKQVLQEELKIVDEKLGLPTNGEKAYEAFDDLKKAVEDNDMDERFAEELAVTRRQQAAAEKSKTNNSALTQEQQRRLNHANEQVTKLGKSLRKDPLFEKKMVAMKPKFAEIQKTLPPEEWATEIAAAWLEVKVEDEAPPARHKPRLDPDKIPLRPSGGAGQGTLDKAGSTRAQRVAQQMGVKF